MFLDLVWLICRANSKAAKITSSYVSKELKDNCIEVITTISNSSDNSLVQLLESTKQLPSLAIVLGGDGTVLHAAQQLAKHNIPILSFNVGGNLGFLTHDGNLLNDSTIWKTIIENKFSIHQRMMLEARIERNGLKNNSTPNALNDFYIRSSHEDNSPTCTLELEIDGEVVDQYRGDGLIVSTPTGSTAYSMASGGPILHPEIEAIIVSPICPMSLSSRPIIVPSSSRLVVKVKPLCNQTQRVKLWQDGAGGDLIEPGERCIINRASNNVKMMILEQSTSYYRTLTQKLHWAGSINRKKN